MVPFRNHTVPIRLDQPVPTQTAQQVPGLATWPAGAMFAKNNGTAADTRYHPTSDPFLTITAHDTTSLAAIDSHGPVRLNDVRFRMLTVDEIRKTMGHPDD